MRLYEPTYNGCIQSAYLHQCDPRQSTYDETIWPLTQCCMKDYCNLVNQKILNMAQLKRRFVVKFKPPKQKKSTTLAATTTIIHRYSLYENVDNTNIQIEDFQMKQLTQADVRLYDENFLLMIIGISVLLILSTLLVSGVAFCWRNIKT